MNFLLIYLCCVTITQTKISTKFQRTKKMQSKQEQTREKIVYNYCLDDGGSMVKLAKSIKWLNNILLTVMLEENVVLE